MPLYDFRCRDTGQIYEQQMKIAEVENFLLENPTFEKVLLRAPPIGDPVRLGVRKNDAGWREVLQKISSRTPGGEQLKDCIR